MRQVERIEFPSTSAWATARRCPAESLFMAVWYA